LIDEDWSDRGCLVPYKDMWWDTPARAAPQRAIVSERGMAEAFSRYYNDRSLVLEHGKNARNYARKNYDWNGVVAEKWINLFKRIEKETGL
jgi:glycosyltransferase involved in cell wall biosynthesis